jgi:hypothetical protein
MSGLVVFNEWIPTDCGATTAWTPSSGCGGVELLMPTTEAVSVIDVNIFAPLGQEPGVYPIALFVNGRAFFAVGPTPAFSVSGNTITWLSPVYSVVPSDEVVAVYYYTTS